MSRSNWIIRLCSPAMTLRAKPFDAPPVPRIFLDRVSNTNPHAAYTREVISTGCCQCGL